MERQDAGEATYAKLDRQREVLEVTNLGLGSCATGSVAFDVNVRRLNNTLLALESSRNETVDKLVSSCGMQSVRGPKTISDGDAEVMNRTDVDQSNWIIVASRTHRKPWTR